MGGAVIEAATIEAATIEPGTIEPSAILLVHNRRRGGVSDWTPPGGVIDHGETLLSGLTREVVEETGLSVLRWATEPLYEIEADAPGLGWRLRVEVHLAMEVEGSLRTGTDPDGIVVAADVVAVDDCESRLGDAHPWVREPLMEWVAERWSSTRRFRYVVEGTDPARLQIARDDRSAGSERPAGPTAARRATKNRHH